MSKEGKSFLKPEVVTVGEEITLTLTFIAGKATIKKGDRVIISVFGKDTFDRFYTGNNLPEEDNNIVYVSAHCQKGNVELSTKNGNVFRIIEIKSDVDLYSGDKIEIILTGKNNKGLKIKSYTHIYKFNVHLERDRKHFSLPDPPILKVKSSSPHKLVTYAPSTGIRGENLEILIKAIDKYSNIAEDYEGKINIFSADITDGKSRFLSSYSFTERDKGKVDLKVKFDKPGIYTLKVEDKENNLIGKSNPIEIKKEKPSYKLYWGEIHGHTILSDALETPDFYFWWAKKVERLDFSALSDHAYGNDTEDLDYPALKDDDKFKSYRKSLPEPEFPFWPSQIGRWTITKYVTERWNQPDKFITLLGYEWTGGHHGVIKYGNYGHKNVYYSGSNGACFNYTDCKDPEELWKTLSKFSKPFITIAHHPAYSFEGVCGTDWSFHNDKFQPLVEIYSKHGCSEFFNNPRPLIFQRKGGFVQDALAKGYKLGIIAGSDTHISRPGSNCPEGSKELRYPSGLTAVFAKSLSREDIFNALKNRRCYATTGARIILEFKINGYFMGEEIVAKEERKIEVRVIGQERIEKIDIVRNNQNIYTYKGKEEIEEFEYVDREKASEILSNSFKNILFYYIRVTQVDGEMAWSSPIWIKIQS